MRFAVPVRDAVIAVGKGVLSVWGKGRYVEWMLTPSWWLGGDGPEEVAFYAGFEDEAVLLSLGLRGFGNDVGK